MNKQQNKQQNKICKKEMTFDDCELAILRHAVDESGKRIKRQDAKNEDVKRMITILEEYLRRKKLVCYGGIAINNILPKDAQFYDNDAEIPDYDFYSPNALADAKELADIYYEKGFRNIEAKAGVHHGTFKVYVNFIPIADITYLEKPIFRNITKECIEIDGIRYAPPNFLRMNIFKELSRPQGDVSRWEKVLKRMVLLNKYYPFFPQNQEKAKCEGMDFQRKMDTVITEKEQEELFYTVRNALIQEGAIFFGGYANIMYSRYSPKIRQHLLKSNPDFDVLSEDPDATAELLVSKLKEHGFQSVKVKRHNELGELIPESREIMIGKETVAFIYKPIACHSYNVLRVGEFNVKIATIDTMLTFYLAFTYADREYYDKDRIFCMAQNLFDIEQQNRLAQYGLLKRFSIECYGKENSLQDIRAIKAEKFRELGDSRKKNTPEYEMWFLKYTPKEGKRGEENGIEKEPESKKTPLYSLKRATTTKKCKYGRFKTGKCRKTRKEKKREFFFFD